jgi:hypothetical protein
MMNMDKKINGGMLDVNCFFRNFVTILYFLLFVTYPK